MPSLVQLHKLCSQWPLSLFPQKRVNDASMDGGVPREQDAEVAASMDGGVLRELGAEA